MRVKKFPILLATCTGFCMPGTRNPAICWGARIYRVGKPYKDRSSESVRQLLRPAP
jgi:hypothetical protein